jgi:hypothetical protein
VPSWQVIEYTLLQSPSDKHLTVYSAFHMGYEVLTIIDTLMTEAVGSTKMLVSIYGTTQCHDLNIA